MKNLFKVLSLSALVAVVFASCEKEPSENTAQESLVIEEPDYLRVERTYSATTKKGYVKDYTGAINVPGGLIVFDALDRQGNRYKTLGVKKPNGDYFYIMIENFRYINGSWGSWDYGHNAANRAKYGRLYYWERAAEYAASVSLHLPVRPGVLRRVSGKLPTRQHFAMMLNKITADSLPDGVGIDGYASDILGGDLNATYFDLFTFGVDQTGLEGGYHSLGGKRDDAGYVPNDIEFKELNQQGFFWTRDASSSPSFHYPLQLLYKDAHGSNYNYSAFINAGHHNHFAYSVRYVFDPNE